MLQTFKKLRDAGKRLTSNTCLIVMILKEGQLTLPLDWGLFLPLVYVFTFDFETIKYEEDQF